MAKIAIKQVLYNVKQKYVEATGDTSKITYGNIDDKVESGIKSGIGMERDGSCTKPIVINFLYDLSISNIEVVTNV